MAVTYAKNLEEINVPFNCKKAARTHGAVFGVNTRKWYIPEGASEEDINYLRNIEEEVKKQIKNNPVLEMVNELPNEAFTTADTPKETAKETPTKIEEKIETKEEVKEEVKDITSIPATPVSFDWKSVIESESSARALVAILENGLPDTPEERTLALRTLRMRGEGQYAVEYFQLNAVSESFRNQYPEDYIEGLIRSTIKGIAPWNEEVMQSTKLTAEEKELLFFVLPLNG